MKFPKVDLWIIAVWVVVLLYVFSLIVTYSNYFSTTITVKEKTTYGFGYGFGKTKNSVIIDATGKVYTVNPMYLVGHFDAITTYTALEIGKTYHISGYGVTIPILQMYPNITKVSTP